MNAASKIANVEAYDENGELHFFDEDVWTAFEAVGIGRTIAGRKRFNSSRLDMTHFPELAVCDFCHERPVRWDVDADTFTTTMVNFTSVGGWAACEACGQAIKDDDRATLCARALAFQRKLAGDRPGAQLPRILAALEMLEGFWRHYRGIKRFNTPYA
jgi:hypothetical protein